MQNPPAAWASMSYSQMLDAMYDHVFPATPVLVHLAQPQNLGSVQNFLNAYGTSPACPPTPRAATWRVYSPFATYGSGAWDPATLRPTAAMDGFLDV
ncbi:hypothetical protein [Nonomuraea jabiensis]|uniref:hypothetical protein n=1 Tax=Nonomuraea jabiensis TaxID=882448 RepID=UPI003D7390FF